MLLKDKKIFIVENNSGNLAIATIYLRQQGATICYSRRGNDAVERMKSSLPIDIVLMDLMLSQTQTGYDVFNNIRSQPELQDIPVVIVSAADPSIAIPRARAMGFSGYIAKPISARITFQIADVIAGQSVWDDDIVF